MITNKDISEEIQNIDKNAVKDSSEILFVISSSISTKFGFLERSLIFALLDVMKLSTQITLLPPSSSLLQRASPISPAPPVTSIVFICDKYGDRNNF